MKDRYFYVLAALAVAGMIALALFWPHGASA